MGCRSGASALPDICKNVLAMNPVLWISLPKPQNMKEAGISISWKQTAGKDAHTVLSNNLQPSVRGRGPARGQNFPGFVQPINSCPAGDVVLKPFFFQCFRSLQGNKSAILRCECVCVQSPMEPVLRWPSLRLLLRRETQAGGRTHTLSEGPPAPLKSSCDLVPVTLPTPSRRPPGGFPSSERVSSYSGCSPRRTIRGQPPNTEIAC